MLLDSGNGRGQLGVLASASDAASMKPMKQVDVRDDSRLMQVDVKDKGGEISRPGKTARTMPGNWLTAAEHHGHSGKAWCERVERIRLCRFALDGDILGSKSFQEQQNGKKTHAESVAERDFLRTEEDPAAIGYTINEAVALTRSMVCFMQLNQTVDGDVTSLRNWIKLQLRLYLPTL